MGADSVYLFGHLETSRYTAIYTNTECRTATELPHTPRVCARSHSFVSLPSSSPRRVLSPVHARHTYGTYTTASREITAAHDKGDHYLKFLGDPITAHTFVD